MTPRPNQEVEMSYDDGWQARPARYSTGDRETIDRMRDLAHLSFDSPELADLASAFHCMATALKYDDRAGKKGAAEPDLQKAAWYRAMAGHVLGEGPDPRAQRPGFTLVTPAAALPDGSVSGELLRLARALRGRLA